MAGGEGSPQGDDLDIVSMLEELVDALSEKIAERRYVKLEAFIAETREHRSGTAEAQPASSKFRVELASKAFFGLAAALTLFASMKDGVGGCLTGDLKAIGRHIYAKIYGKTRYAFRLAKRSSRDR